MRLKETTATTQTGAALASTLFFLLVITLLGLAAMRSGKTDLSLALNEESRMQAVQSADSLLHALLSNSGNLVVEPGSGYVQNCYVSPNLNETALSDLQGFVCPSGTVDVSALPDGPLKKYAYTLIERDTINGSDFAPVAALRRGDSGERFRLASFTVLAGFDRTSLSRASGADDHGNYGAAEVSQGTYIKVDSVDGLVYE